MYFGVMFQICSVKYYEQINKTLLVIGQHNQFCYFIMYLEN